jgi:hypothetical protein
MAEYEALLRGLKFGIEIGIKRLDVRGDSQLVIDQVMKNASCHDDKMEAYCKAMRALEDKFYGIETTCPADITRRRTTSPKSRRGGSPSPRMSSLGTLPSRLSTSNHTPRTAGNPRGLPQI